MVSRIFLRGGGATKEGAFVWFSGPGEGGAILLPLNWDREKFSGKAVLWDEKGKR